MLTPDAVRTRARELGFDLCGIARADAFPELAFYAEWLARGYAGEMHYLVRSAGRREDVRQVLPSARSVISLGTLYNTDRPYSTESADPDRAHIARYAWGDDYHDVIGRRLEALEAWLRTEAGGAVETRRYVDTGPIQERVYAQRAGLGWIGKNTCLINPELGSFLFLSEILCSLDLSADEEGVDQCGTCSLCLEACPTGALVGERELDATRCISYVTIERKGTLSETEQAGIGQHVYGCDICQEVCPWNQSPPVSGDAAWQPRPAFDRPSIAALAAATDDELRAAMRRSAMKRTGVKGLRRNVEAVLAARPRR